MWGKLHAIDVNFFTQGHVFFSVFAQVSIIEPNIDLYS